MIDSARSRVNGRGLGGMPPNELPVVGVVVESRQNLDWSFQQFHENQTENYRLNLVIDLD